MCAPVSISNHVPVNQGCNRDRKIWGGNWVVHLIARGNPKSHSAATCSRWFLARGFFYPEDGGDTFLRNVDPHKIYTAPHRRRRHSSILKSLIWNISFEFFEIVFRFWSSGPWRGSNLKPKAQFSSVMLVSTHFVCSTSPWFVDIMKIRANCPPSSKKKFNLIIHVLEIISL
jgi:hypothetical protein